MSRNSKGRRDRRRVRQVPKLGNSHVNMPSFDEEDEWFRHGQRIALEGMDLPDGAHLGVCDEMDLEP